MVKVFRFDGDTREFSANTYVIGKIGHNCIVVDLGTTSDDVYDYVSSQYEGVAAILLTHAHYDHIRGVSSFLKKLKKPAPVFLSPADIELLSHPELNCSKRNGENVTGSFQVVTFRDQEFLPINNIRVQVIATPFHTRGSVCYLFPDENALFTGDTLFAGSIGKVETPTGNPMQVNSSLGKLQGLSDTLVVYPGHGAITRLGTEKETNPFMIALK